MVGYKRRANSRFYHRPQRRGDDRALGTLGGVNSKSYDINDTAQVVGRSQAKDGAYHAFITDGKCLGSSTAAPSIRPWRKSSSASLAFVRE